MINQRIKKIEKQLKGQDYRKERRIEALYNYFLTGDSSYLDKTGNLKAEIIWTALKKAEKKAEEIGIDNVKGLKVAKERSQKELKAEREEQKAKYAKRN